MCVFYMKIPCVVFRWNPVRSDVLASWAVCTKTWYLCTQVRQEPTGNPACSVSSQWSTRRCQSFRWRALPIRPFPMKRKTADQHGREIFEFCFLCYIRLSNVIDVTADTTHLGLPHEPKLEHVRPASALYVFVTGVVRRVVKLVFLEQILSARWIAVGQHAFVFGQKRRTLLGRREHFVRVPRDRVSPAVMSGKTREKSLKKFPYTLDSEIVLREFLNNK